MNRKIKGGANIILKHGKETWDGQNRQKLEEHKQLRKEIGTN